MDSRTRSGEGGALQLRSRIPRIFWVTNDRVATAPDFLGRARAAMAAGGGECAVQLRGHGLSGRRLTELALALAESTAATGAGVWVNDRVDVAIAVRAEGVQLGRRSLPLQAARALLGRSCWLGASVHTPGEAERRFEEGADVVVLGSVFPTSSHPERGALGLEAVRVAAASGRPIVAIGGIGIERVQETIEAGAWGIAVLSGLWDHDDPAARAGAYAEAVRAALAARAEVA